MADKYKPGDRVFVTPDLPKADWSLDAHAKRLAAIRQTGTVLKTYRGHGICYAVELGGASPRDATFDEAELSPIDPESEAFPLPIAAAAPPGVVARAASFLVWAGLDNKLPISANDRLRALGLAFECHWSEIREAQLDQAQRTMEEATAKIGDGSASASLPPLPRPGQSS